MSLDLLAPAYVLEQRLQIGVFDCGKARYAPWTAVARSTSSPGALQAGERLLRAGVDPVHVGAHLLSLLEGDEVRTPSGTQYRIREAS